MARKNLNDLLGFVTVAREGSFTRAAATLGVTQSALSQSIRGLEERLRIGPEMYAAARDAGWTDLVVVGQVLTVVDLMESALTGDGHAGGPAPVVQHSTGEEQA